MSPVLKYHTGGGVYADLPGSIEEVTISPNQPPVNTDLWVDTDDDSGGTANLLSGFRNVIRNGDMSIAQRGNGPFTAVVSLDGYSQSWSGGSCSTSRVNQAVGAGSPFLAATVSGQSLVAHFFVISMAVENVQTLSGQTVTFSFDAKAASGTPKIGLELEQYYGVGGSGYPRMNPGTVTLSTTKTRYSVTFTVPPATGTIGTAGDCLYLRFWLSAGADYASRASSIGIQNNTFSITDVQLEEGTVATPFERLPIQQQLAWCQRYFQRLGKSNPHVIGDTNSDVQIGSIWEISTTGSTVLLKFPPMRAAATMSINAITSFYVSLGNTGNYVTSLLASKSGSDSGWLQVSHSTMGAIGWAGGFSANGPAYIDLSAEL